MAPRVGGLKPWDLVRNLFLRKVSLATSLLARAVKFGQQRQILSGFISQPGGLKSSAVAADSVMKDINSKRNRDEAERLSAGFEEPEWDELSFNGGSPVTQHFSSDAGRSFLCSS